MGRLANPEELVGAVLYLASGASSYVSGQTIVIDGGLTTGGDFDK
jgi:NAD(P)-dependent dehydrogenase (short-subunit alcohol dehydrogenase family)